MSIVLSPTTRDDVAEFYKVVMESAEHLRPWMDWCHKDYGELDAEGWVDLCIHDWQKSVAFRYLIRSAVTYEILGAVGIERTIGAHRIGELGYWVSSKALNRGVATEAARQAVQKAFKEHGLSRVEIIVLTDNHASNKVARKIGGLFEGALRNRLFHDGRSKAANCYSLVPEDIKN